MSADVIQLIPTLRLNFSRTKEYMAKLMVTSDLGYFHTVSKIKLKKLLEWIFHKVQKTSILSQKL
jgi:hypothetical protein